MVAGDYVTPPCPSERTLRALLEIAYLAGQAAEESRYPKFNLVAVPADDQTQRAHLPQKWPFLEQREYSVSELRRLAPATDPRKSAIWVEWHKSTWKIVGLVDLGTSWYRARLGMDYAYHYPSCLFVQMEDPGRMRIYQGGYHVATLSHGEISGHKGMNLDISLHKPVNDGLRILRKELTAPKVEPLRDVEGYEFVAMYNVFAGIANSISLSGHGGAVIITPPNYKKALKQLRIKYSQHSQLLHDNFIEFIKARHDWGDIVWDIEENSKELPPEVLPKADLLIRDAYAQVVESTRFIAQLAGCDGSIVVTQDFRLIGFGAEIVSTFRRGIPVFESKGLGPHGKGVELDVENFGMRHRSAVKFVSQCPECQVIVISQDGPISVVWSDHGTVYVRKALNLVSMSMPWA